MKIETIKFLKAITAAFGANDAVQFEQVTWEKIHAGIKEAIAELESQEPDYWLGYGLQAHTEKPFENATALYRHPPQRTEQEPLALDLSHI